MVTGVANVIFTFVAIYTVERLGRRILMLLGAGGLAGIYLILGTCYFFEVSGFFMVVLVVLAIACYAIVGANHLGTARRDLPEPSTCRCDGYLYICFMGR